MRKVYLKGELDHVGLTRVPINPRTGFTHAMEMKSMPKTRKDDALSIVGDEYTDDIDELEKKQRTQKADVDDLVIKAEDESYEEHENQEIILRAMLKDEGYDEEAIEKAQWDYAYKKSLPNSAYAWIEKGCAKEDGKTPQKCRHLPFKDKSGKVDCPHVRAALQAIGGARTGKKMSPPSGVAQKLRRALKGCQRSKAETSKAEVLDIDLDEYEQGRVDGFNLALDLDIPEDKEAETMSDEAKEPKEEKSGIDLDAINEEFKPEEPAEEKAEVEELDPIDRHVDLLKQLIVAEGYGREKKIEAGQNILRSLAAHVQAGIDESTPASPEDVAKSVVAQLDARLKPLLNEIAVIKAQLTGQTRPEAPPSTALSFDTSPTAPVEKSGESFQIDPISTMIAAQQGQGSGEKSQIKDIARATTGLPTDPL